MRKRSPKKLHRKDVQELGLRLRFEFPIAISTDQRNQLLEDFVTQAIEANGLAFGGGGTGSVWDGFVTLDAPSGSVTEAHREKLIHWLETNPRVLNYEVGPLVDSLARVNRGRARLSSAARAPCRGQGD